MGYDNDECVYCYALDSGNNPNCSEHFVCAVCADRLIQMGGSTARFKWGWVEFLKDGDLSEEGAVCHLCLRTRHMLFRAPCCNVHEAKFEDAEDYSSE